MKKEYIETYKRIKLLVVNPELAWQQIEEEKTGEKYLRRTFLLPIAVLTSCIVFSLCLIDYTLWQSLCLGFIRLIAIMIGTRLAYLIIREYLCRKLNFSDHQAQNITIYSSCVFCLFQGIGVAIGSNNFWGQLFIVFSFIFIRTLYYGLNQLVGLKPGQKNNILVIATLSIIVMPIIIAHILTILFQIPAINI